MNLSEQVAKLENYIKELEARLTPIEHEGLLDKIERLEAELENGVRRNGNLMCRLKASDTVMDDLRRQLERAQQGNDEWGDRYLELQKQLKELEARPTLVEQGQLLDRIKHLEGVLACKESHFQAMSSQLERAKKECLRLMEVVRGKEEAIQNHERIDRDAKKFIESQREERGELSLKYEAMVRERNRESNKAYEAKEKVADLAMRLYNARWAGGLLATTCIVLAGSILIWWLR